MYKKEVLHLKSDPVMKGLIETHGELEWSESKDLFIDLVNAIVSQQLSGKAASTIFGRFKKLFGKKFPTPKQILKMPDQTLRDVGLSWAKVKYIKNLSEAVDEKRLVLGDLHRMEDEVVIEKLIQVKGIGRWTAEMILMFSLGRPDVFSFGDLGLKKAIANLYGVDSKDMEKIREISFSRRKRILFSLKRKGITSSQKNEICLSLSRKTCSF